MDLLTVLSDEGGKHKGAQNNCCNIMTTIQILKIFRKYKFNVHEMMWFFSLESEEK